jgi:hypothetical protein
VDCIAVVKVGMWAVELAVGRWVAEVGPEGRNERVVVVEADARFVLGGNNLGAGVRMARLSCLGAGKIQNRERLWSQDGGLFGLGDLSR